MSNPTLFGYLERPYLQDSYLTEIALMAYGMQTTLVIATSKDVGMQTKQVIAATDAVGQQVKGNIVNFPKPVGMQTSQTINAKTPKGMQAKLVIAATDPVGQQVKAIINALTAEGMQVKAQIVNHPSPVGLQTKLVINAAPAYGAQVKLVIAATVSAAEQTEITINATKPIGMQVLQSLAASMTPKGMQATLVVLSKAATAKQATLILSKQPAVGMQVQAHINNFTKPLGSNLVHTNIAHWMLYGYLTRPYLVDPYLTGIEIAQAGMQVAQTVTNGGTRGMQVEQTIKHLTSVAEQSKLIINARDPIAQQILGQIKNHPSPTAEQIKGIIHATPSFGMQIRGVILATTARGMQVTRIQAQEYGMQVRAVLYNDTNLRILADFPSRGLDGLNWVASSTASGDFGANNLNTDIVEQQWRSAPGHTTSITLDCDTQTTQVFVDTFCMFNHNLTTSAVVVLEGSVNSDHSLPGESITIPITKLNAYYIAPTLPTNGYRYWRVNINDPTNPDGQIKIGTIVFGAARILQGDNITDHVVRKKVHFSDKIQTEGYTDVQNDRALKYATTIQFKNLDYTKGNFTLLDELFDLARTSLKCVWIPDPQVPTRFGAFAKMKQIPDVEANHLAVDASYVDMTVEVDESL